MSEYLLRWVTADGRELNITLPDEGGLRGAFAQAVVDGGNILEIAIHARIIKRRKGTPAPAKEATPPPLPGAGGSSPEKQLSTKGLAPKCSDGGCAFDADFNSEKCRGHAPKKRKASGEARAASAPESAK